MKQIVYTLFLCTMFWSAYLPGQSYSLNLSESLETHPNQYFVKLCQGISNQEVKVLLSELNSVELWKNDKIGLRLWAVKRFPYSCSDGEITDINGHLVRSQKKTNIDDVTLDMVFQLEETEFEPASTYFDNLNLRGNLGPNPIRIAILDSGISDEAIASSSYFSGLQGYSGYDYVHNDPLPDDENGHGTQVAGIIYALVSQLGVPANISLDIRKTHDVYGLGNISDLITATIDAVEAGADIINMSFSYYEMLDSEHLNPLQLAIDYAEQHGVLVVASAGNNFRDNDNSDAVPVPSTFPNENIISVASNRPDESRSFFSNYGASTVDVSILGEHIPSPGLHGERFHSSGTSFSTAIVSGLSAILGSRQDQFNACAVKCILINTSKEVSGWRGYNLAGGVINFRKALDDPPYECTVNCPTVTEPAELHCGANCPPEVYDMDLCVEDGITVVDKLLAYDPEQDAIAFRQDPVYGPFNGNLIINPDGSFIYTSFSGKRDMFVYQVCDNNTAPCSDGCNQGVVYINSANCTLPSDNGEYLNTQVADCVKATGEKPKLLAFRYTGKACNATDHHQDPRKVACSGDPASAPLVYLTVTGDFKEYYLVNHPVALGKTFVIDAAVVAKDHLEATTIIQVKNAENKVLQTVSLHTSGSQPLMIGDRFAGFELEGYLAKNNGVCGSVDLENRDVFDCKKDTGENPRLLTFRYSGQGCSFSDHHQDPNKGACLGDPNFAEQVYVTAIGNSDKYYSFNQKVALGKTFSIDAASVGDNKLEGTTTIYLKDKAGKVLQKIELHTSGSQPLGTNDQFGSLSLKGYLSEHGKTCGLPEIPEVAGDCCHTTGKRAQILTFQYTGKDDQASSHNQAPGSVICSGDPEFSPFVYITAELIEKDRIVLFRDLQVPLHGLFDIDAASFGKNKFETPVMIYLKDEFGNVLQTIEFEASCSEPLVIGNQFGALQLKGYLAENGELRGSPPVSEVCNPTFGCEAAGRRSAIGLVYIGSTTTTVDAYRNSDSREYLGTYNNVGPGDFLVFSSWFFNKNDLGHFFLQWAGGQEIEIPVETSVEILGNVYGDFKVVQQLDQEGNDCRIPYSSCYEVNRICGEPATYAQQETTPDLLEVQPLDHSSGELLSEKSLRLYPNPARDAAYLDLAEFSDQVLSIDIYDPVGRLVLRENAVQAGDKPWEIRVTNLASGIYSVVVHSGEGSPILQKLVVAGH